MTAEQISEPQWRMRVRDAYDEGRDPLRRIANDLVTALTQAREDSKTALDYMQERLTQARTERDKVREKIAALEIDREARMDVNRILREQVENLQAIVANLRGED